MASAGGTSVPATDTSKASLVELDKNMHESLQASLKLVLEVRASAHDVFKTFLDGGVCPELSGNGTNGSGGGGGGKDLTKEKTGGTDTKYLSQIKLKLDNVDAKIKELESIVSKPHPSLSHPLGHSLYLNVDSGQENVGLYNSLVTSYGWWNKTHDYAAGAVQLLSQNSLSRSKQSTVQLHKRRRPGELTNKAYSAQPQQLDQLINQVSNMYQDMRFKVTRPNASKFSAVVEVTLDRLLTVALVFKGLMIEWVMVRGYDEAHRRQDSASASNAAGAADPSCPDVWTESRYQVFRRITDNANAAMLHYGHPSFPEMATIHFFTYLHSFVNLFTEKCRSCGYHLHNNMPPTWREFKSLEPYHDDCKK